METYSTSFTIPRSSGQVAYPGERPGPSNGGAGPTGQSGEGGSSGLSSSGLGSSLLSGSSFLGFDRPDALSLRSRQSQQQQQQPQASQQQTQQQDVSTFGRLGSMRSRLPPSVKAFMPAAFGGLKRTSERIAEAAAGSEKESEAEGEIEDPAPPPIQKDSKSAKKEKEDKESEKDKEADKAVLKGTGEEKTAEKTAEMHVGKSLPETILEKGKTKHRPSEAEQIRQEAIKGDVSTNKASSPKAPAQASNDAKSAAQSHDDVTVSGAANNKAATSVPSSQQQLNSENDEVVAAPSKNRGSQSTVGTTSSNDAASAISAESTAPSTVPFESVKAHQTPPEPRSVSHSASNSLSIFGAQQSTYFADDLAESMQRLSADATNQYQCLVTNSSVQGDGVRTMHPNGSSTSISSLDPYNRHTFPSMPTSSSHYTPMGQSIDSAGTSASPFGNNAFGQSRSSLSSIVPSTSQMPSQATRGTLKKTNYNFHISGNSQQVMAARGHILRDHPFRTRQTIKVARNEITDVTPPIVEGQSILPRDCLKIEVQKRLEDISIASNCLITVLGKEVQRQQVTRGLETERYAELCVSGSFEAAEQATIRIMVMLDELNGLHSESCEIDYKLHNIIGGRKRSVIQKVIEETSTNIYLPTSFPGVLSANRNPGIIVRQNTILITGEYLNVQRARDMLYQVSMHKHKSIISRNIAVLHRKIDWLLTERLDDLRAVMHDNATFISLPTLGSQSSVITVYGDSRVSIERTIRSIMQLACQFFVAQVWLLPVVFDGVVASTPLSSTQMTPVIKHVSSTSGAEVAFKSNSFEIYGLEVEVRQAVAMILDMDALKPYNVEVRFQIELANEHREFISGKKNGKINKIMKQGIRVKFETFNDYNFLIDVASSDRVGTLQGLNLLLEELPAEVSFHIPENYHKRIIGVGGKNIQKTMKKYGVYVKFYAKSELDAETYPFFEAEDNVIARTPAKNAVNLDNLKAAVMELVSPKDKDYVSENVPIARRYHRTLLGEKGVYIHDIEAKLGCMIRFPPSEAASDLVSIFGPESQIHMASQMLLDHVPCEAEFRAPQSHDLTRLLASHEFVALTERVKRDLNIRIVPMTRRDSRHSASPAAEYAKTKVEEEPDQSPSSAKTAAAEKPSDVVFKLKLNRSSIDFLPAAKDTLKDFLVSRNIAVYSTNERNRSDSFASSFQHFANKLISVPQAAESTDSFQTDPAARHREHQQEHRGHVRAAASTPDIKALFDSPAVGQDNFVSNNAQTMNASYSAVPVQGALRNNFSYTGSYSSAPGMGGSEVWGAPVLAPYPTGPRTSTVSLSNLPPSQQGIAFPQQAQQSRDSRPPDDFMTSDQMTAELTDVDNRGNFRKTPRSYSQRTQSLDIGALAAQQVIQQANAGVSARGVLDPVGSSSGLTAQQPTNFKMSQSSLPRPPLGAIGSRPASNASLHGTANSQRFSHSPTGSFFGNVNANDNNVLSSATHAMQTTGGAMSSQWSAMSQQQQHQQHHHAAHHSMPSPIHTQAMHQYQAGAPQQFTDHEQQKQLQFPSHSVFNNPRPSTVAAGLPGAPTHQHQMPPYPPQGSGVGSFAAGLATNQQHFAHSQARPLPPQQQHHHHAPSPSITRLDPSLMQRGPEPETADEVMRSLSQLNFNNTSA